MAKPEMKQFGDLTREDFNRYPVWIACHSVDYEEPWYDDTDEETFRPWDGPLPADASQAILLVRATIELRDGSRHWGFITPAVSPGDLGTQQPHIWVGDRCFGIWGGMVGVPVEERQAFYAAIGRVPDAIFPLRYAIDPKLAIGESSGQAYGFYRDELGNNDCQIEV